MVVRAPGWSIFLTNDFAAVRLAILRSRGTIIKLHFHARSSQDSMKLHLLALNSTRYNASRSKLFESRSPWITLPVFAGDARASTELYQAGMRIKCSIYAQSLAAL